MNEYHRVAEAGADGIQCLLCLYSSRALDDFFNYAPLYPSQRARNTDGAAGPAEVTGPATSRAGLSSVHELFCSWGLQRRSRGNSGAVGRWDPWGTVIARPSFRRRKRGHPETLSDFYLQSHYLKCRFWRHFRMPGNAPCPLISLQSVRKTFKSHSHICCQMAAEPITVESMKSRPSLPPGPLSKAVSKLVRSEINDRKITQSELAERLGKSRSYVSERLNDAVTWNVNDLEEVGDVLSLGAHGLFLRALQIYETEKHLERFASDFVVQFLRDMTPPSEVSPDEAEIREIYRQWVQQRGE